jgi:formyltetrahydrofolate deformylase
MTSPGTGPGPHGSTQEPGKSTLATLLVSCPDRKGLVAALAQFLYGYGCNIVDADQHTDPTAAMFFQRIRFDIREMHTDQVAFEHGLEEVATRFDMKFRLSYERLPKRLALFVSKYDHCLYDLLLRHRAGELACEFSLVVSNHEDLRPVADLFNVPFHMFPITKENKAEQEQKQWDLCQAVGVDLIVLARYMQVLSADFTRRYPNRIINIHHSFLPAFMGGKPYHRAHERGVKLIGATAHYATSDLDEGPIIEQDVIRTSHKDSVDDLVRKGRDMEKVALARAVKWHIEDRILVYGNKTVVFG